jgi:basic membrane protein A
MGFLAGVLAARISKTHIVGAACETGDIDSMWRYCEGFRAGAKFADENIKVLVAYRDDASRDDLFINDTWGYETAQDLIHSGADVIFAAGGATGEGALRAAVDSQVYAIGSERDQGAVFGSRVVTSVYGRASFEVQNVMRVLRGENAEGQGSIQIGYVPLDKKFPESLVQELDIMLFGLSSGQIPTGVLPGRP